jgi:phosphate uptake ABC transporter, phoT family, ATP-binding protein
VLLLDEPCSALDIDNTLLIEKLLMKLKESISIIIVTHNIEQAKRIGDEIITMKSGNLSEGISL